MLYINIHTHHTAGNKEILEVHSLLHQQISVAETNPKKLFSFGIHPWNSAEVDYSEAMMLLRHAGGLKNIIAFGECGIDKPKIISLDQQIEIFKIHISLSEEFKKPLIIHCVKAYEEIYQIRKQFNAKQPWIIHRFRKGLSLANQLVHHGTYLSFGFSLQDPNHDNASVFALIPDHSYFLETDDVDGKEIERIYKFAAQIKNTTIEKIASIIKENFEKCFNINVYDWI